MPEIILQTLAIYGAHLNAGGFICRADSETGIRIIKKGRRLRYESRAGNLMASGPVSAEGVASFVEKFWFWERVA